MLQRLEQHTVRSSPRVPGTPAHTDTNSNSPLPQKGPTASSLQGSQRHQETKAKATVCTSEILGFHQNLVQRASLADPRRHKGTSPCHVGKLERCSDRSANPALVLTPNAMRGLVRMQKRVHGMRTMPGSAAADTSATRMGPCDREGGECMSLAGGNGTSGASLSSAFQRVIPISFTKRAQRPLTPAVPCTPLKQQDLRPPLPFPARVAPQLCSSSPE